MWTACRARKLERVPGRFVIYLRRLEVATTGMPLLRRPGRLVRRARHQREGVVHTVESTVIVGARWRRELLGPAVGSEAAEQPFVEAI